MVSAIPEGTRTVTPHLIVKGARKAIDFYARAFGARELYHMDGPGGSIVHAELQVGDSRLYLADESPMGAGRAPQTLKGSSVAIHLFVPDVDASFQRAMGAGARVTQPLMDMFWGDRFGQVSDPFGHIWSLATHKEDVPPDEMARRGQEAMAAMAAPPPARKAAPASRKRSAPKKVDGRKKRRR